MNLFRRLWRVLSAADAREDYAAAHEDFEAIDSYLEMLTRAVTNPGVYQWRQGKMPKDTSDLVGGTRAIRWNGFGRGREPVADAVDVTFTGVTGATVKAVVIGRDTGEYTLEPEEGSECLDAT